MGVVERVITVARDGFEGLDPGAVQRSLDNLDVKPTGGGSPFRGVTVFQNGTAKFDDVILIKDDAGKVMLEFFKGAAEPSAAAGDAPGTIRLPAGDIINVRNIQGGIYVAGSPALLNLDLGSGAGDSSPGNHSADGKRGNIGFNYDVGCGAIFYDGRAPEGGTLIHQVAAFNQTSDNTNGSGLIEMWRPVVLRSKNGTSGDVAINTGIQADTHPRWQVLQDGYMGWGAGGTSAGDTTLYRYAANALKTDGTLYVGLDAILGGGMSVNAGANFGGNLITPGNISAGSFTTTSDKRLKTAVSPLTGALANVNALRPVNFEWVKGAAGDAAGAQVGLLAQEVQQVVPQAVRVSPTEAMPDRLGIDYAALVPVLIGAIQELSAEVQALKAKAGGA